MQTGGIRIVAVCLVVLTVLNGTYIAYAQHDTLPPPHATKSSRNFSNVIGWEGDEAPVAPTGFVVKRFAEGFENPRWLYELPGGDILVAESNTYHPWYERIGGWIIGANKSNNLRPSADRITLLRDADHDGVPELRTTFLDRLNQPFGMLVLGDWFYVANTDALWRYPYSKGQTRIIGKGQKILDLPAGKHNRHWTRNIISNAAGTRIYIAVGSGSNVAEKGIANEFLRAAILEVKSDGSALRVYAAGLRNPVGMAWNPEAQKETLWTVVNERDLLGDDLVPDYLTRVQENGFYGWPYRYHGTHIDDRVKDATPAEAEQTIAPDIDLDAHSASLGLTFYTGKAFPERYRNGAFIAQHGSWNRSTLSGYKVVFVPFNASKPSGPPEDFLTGFIENLSKEKVHGRPVCIIMQSTGTLLLTDDTSNTLWLIAHP